MASEENESSKTPSETVDSELDQYDLLGADELSEPLVPRPDLAATAQAFNSRIQRKKREQEKVISESDKLTKQRQLRLLSALMKIRRSLRDVTRIDLGDRFHFVLRADDWQGWPRLAIKLKDAKLPNNDYPSFRVTAHDRQDRGTIEIEFDPSCGPEHISVASESELKRLAPQLKRCVRAFLDLTGDIVLNAERRPEEPVAEKELSTKSIPGLEPVEDADAPHIAADFIDEDAAIDDFLERLPKLEQVDSLPDFGNGRSAKSLRKL